MMKKYLFLYVCVLCSLQVKSEGGEEASREVKKDPFKQVKQQRRPQLKSPPVEERGSFVRGILDDPVTVGSRREGQVGVVKSEPYRSEDPFVDEILSDDFTMPSISPRDTDSDITTPPSSLQLEGQPESDLKELHLTAEEQELYFAFTSMKKQVKEGTRDAEEMQTERDLLKEKLQDYFDGNGDPNVRLADPIERVERGKPVTLYDSPESLLKLAIGSGDPDIVKMVLDHGATLTDTSMEEALDQYRSLFSLGSRYGVQGVFPYSSLRVPQLSPEEKKEKEERFEYIKKYPVRGRAGFALSDAYTWIARRFGDTVSRFMPGYKGRPEAEALARKNAQQRAEVVFLLYEHGAPVTAEQRYDVRTLEDEYAHVWSVVSHHVKRFARGLAQRFA